MGFSELLQEQDSFDSSHSSSSQLSLQQSNNSEAKRNDEVRGVEQRVQKENRRVSAFRGLLILSLLGVGAALSYLTYSILSGELSDDAADSFTSFANGVEDSFQVAVRDIFDANRALAQSIASSALEHQEEFPFFSVPYFEVKANSAREQASFEKITYAPVVTGLQREAYLKFSNAARSWYDESKALFDDLHPGSNRSSEPPTDPIPSTMWKFDNGAYVQDEGSTIMCPSLHVSPPPPLSLPIYQNINLWSDDDYKDATLAALALKDAVFSSFDASFYDDFTAGEFVTQLPYSIAAQPIFKSLRVKETSGGLSVVGYLYSVVNWSHYLANLLPEGVRGIIVVLRNSCNQQYTYQLDGNVANFLGKGDLHDKTYNDYVKTIDFSSNYFDPDLTSKQPGHCQIFLDVYPSVIFKEAFKSKLPLRFSVMVAGLFFIMAVLFACYDKYVTVRNRKVVQVAARSSAIVGSLFPSKIRDRLIDNALNEERKSHGNSRGFRRDEQSEELGTQQDDASTPPMADIFPEATVMFADIVGFTAWSSIREPSQVFQLLETLYGAFDQVARQRGIYKVETIGDCYVAVAGLPDPNPDHGVAMAKFARDVMHKMHVLTRRLQTSLGVDTGDLTLRIGLHSGPVTAGVLRGERSRFQLFGDTINTCARMESTGIANKIQLSHETAELIVKSGNSHWLEPRKDRVQAKGKGELTTFWLTTKSRSETTSSVGSGTQSSSVNFEDQVSEKLNSLIEWNVETLLPFIQKVMDWRRSSGITQQAPLQIRGGIQPSEWIKVKESIGLPSIMGETNGAPNCAVSSKVQTQLRDYVTAICEMYDNSNYFHNFEHASHVTMSVTKLLSRIVAPSDMINDFKDRPVEELTLALHSKTFGISSDPLTQFACVFSALIHDVEHRGVPNFQLCKEDPVLSDLHHGKSVAERNSVHVAWALLMEERFRELLETLCSSQSELTRFRQLVVNSVLATDIFDKDLKKLRTSRWEAAFNASQHEEDNMNRKATIVLEHLIQASDVSHTMQHWHIYRKWNARYFIECYRAFKAGRASQDPSKNWYESELSFFDSYIIPLAKKLHDCGVFGVSSAELLTYATMNRSEWKERGRELVNDMIQQALNDPHCKEVEP